MQDREGLSHLRSELTPGQRLLLARRLRGAAPAAGVQAEIMPRIERERAPWAEVITPERLLDAIPGAKANGHALTFGLGDGVGVPLRD